MIGPIEYRELLLTAELWPIYVQVKDFDKRGANGLQVNIIPEATKIDMLNMEVVTIHHVLITTHIMDIRLCLFNCKGFYISKDKHINEILKSCDILKIREKMTVSIEIGTIKIESVNIILLE